MDLANWPCCLSRILDTIPPTDPSYYVIESFRLICSKISEFFEKSPLSRVVKHPDFQVTV